MIVTPFLYEKAISALFKACIHDIISFMHFNLMQNLVKANVSTMNILL